ncbi:MAG: DHH family phosphoesterase [Defluviitaleaceae bacterium]|nr:DHH family phosphoesterase [Defluviitaleaceae bacterium]
MNENWVLRETDADLPLMAQVLGVSETTARVMANRGIRTKNTALAFLAPDISRLRDPYKLKDMAKAVEIISAAVTAEKKITIFGDYDVDGIMSTVILQKALRAAGANCEYYIPHRIDEGYGMNIAAVEKIAASGTQLIITVDNGISAIEEIVAARALGVDVVIIDHHEPAFNTEGGEAPFRRGQPAASAHSLEAGDGNSGEISGEGARSLEAETAPRADRIDILPPALAIIDPKQSDCEYPFKEMCAAGLVFLFAVTFAEATSANIPRQELLALAAIATLCDIVNLTDENRIIVTAGLAALNENKLVNPGLGSLITVRGCLQKPIDAFTIGFVLGPCLNATGRLADAALAAELLLAPAEDSEKRLKLATDLASLNDARKVLTAECFERAMVKVRKMFINNVGDSAPEPPQGEAMPPLDPQPESAQRADSDKSFEGGSGGTFSKVPPEKGFEKDLSRVLVVVDADAHESVAGIVAGRVRDATGRPTLVLTRGDNMFKGSGRSIEGYNLFEALYAHRELFHRFGGHAMAAGLTLPEENIDILRCLLNEECTVTDFSQKFHIDGEIAPEEITLALSEELARLAPFGKSNPDPLFAAYGLYAQSVRVLNEKNTLIFTFVCSNGRRLKGVAFGLNEKYNAACALRTPNAGDTCRQQQTPSKPGAISAKNKTGGITLDALFHIETNVWNNAAEVQVRIKDFIITTNA